MLTKKLIKFISHTARFVSNPEKSMHYYKKKSGDPFHFQLNLQHGIWVFGTPEAAQQIFSAKTDVYSTPFPADPIETLLGSGSMILLSGQKHLQEKKCMSPAFHGERMRLYAETIQGLTLAELKSWHVGKYYNLYTVMKNITLNIIINTIFGVTEPDQVAFVRKKTLRFLNSYSPSLMFISILRNRCWTPWNRFVRARTEFEDFLLNQMNDCKRNPQMNRNDILASLALITFPDGTTMSDQNLLDELKTLLMAGHETSATALTWALYYSFSNPHIKVKLEAEMSRLKPDTSMNEIIKLPYLTAVCEEALRIHPVVPLIMRTLNQKMEIGGKEFKRGENIALSITLLHSNPAVWQQPESFDPERFIDKKYSSHEYAPFGGGARRCIGASFALFEMKIVLATLFLNARLSIPNIRNNNARLYGLTMGPRKMISVKIES